MILTGSSLLRKGRWRNRASLHQIHRALLKSPVTRSQVEEEQCAAGVRALVNRGEIPT